MWLEVWLSGRALPPGFVMASSLAFTSHLQQIPQSWHGFLPCASRSQDGSAAFDPPGASSPIVLSTSELLANKMNTITPMKEKVKKPATFTFLADNSWPSK
jgi:hypothetical protein